MRVRWSLFGVRSPLRIARAGGFFSWARREGRAGAAAKSYGALACHAGGEFATTIRNARAPAIWVGEIVHMRWKRPAG